jgi:ATPase subunit of ABC transporter with duplicated ATPase domains
LGKQDIITEANLEVLKGMRLILRGPNGAGKSTILKALSGTIKLEKPSMRFEDERLKLGVFAQDLAQDLPQVEPNKKEWRSL